MESVPSSDAGSITPPVHSHMDYQTLSPLRLTERPLRDRPPPPLSLLSRWSHSQISSWAYGILINHTMFVFVCVLWRGVEVGKDRRLTTSVTALKPKKWGHAVS